jgi:hypothetical protein
VKSHFASESRSGTVGRKPRLAPRLLAVAAMLAISGLLPATAAAHHLEAGMSMSINGNVTLVSGVYLAVPVRVTCPLPTDSFSVIGQDSFGVNVTENVGKALAFGSASNTYVSPLYYYGPVGSPVTCDGSAHSYVLNVFPTPATNGAPPSPPWKKGNKAVISGSFDVLLIDPNQGVFGPTDDNSISFGPLSIAIK